MVFRYLLGLRDLIPVGSSSLGSLAKVCPPRFSSRMLGIEPGVFCMLPVCSATELLALPGSVHWQHQCHQIKGVGLTQSNPRAWDLGISAAQRNGTQMPSKDVLWDTLCLSSEGSKLHGPHPSFSFLTVLHAKFQIE